MGRHFTDKKSMSAAATTSSRGWLQPIKKSHFVPSGRLNWDTTDQPAEKQLQGKSKSTARCSCAGQASGVYWQDQALFPLRVRRTSHG